MRIEFEFETTLGEELLPRDLGGGTYQVTETYVDLDPSGEVVVFTVRVSPHSLDDQTIADIDPDDLPPGAAQ
jgi:hypothetical protein